MTKRIALVAALAAVAAAGLAGPASARWYGNNAWHGDARHWDNHYYGYQYAAPPVVYGTPYNYGYVAPPVVYGGQPGINFNVNIP
jgi:hypothetical protein